ncbi:MAG: TetR/AcrR family transcriptional regulator [Chloroflexota bacterium]|nr:TetR/AcrR family transcriptional regulator [Chloroflexota bacterium]
MDQTRVRIIEAAMRLHTTVGPAETTIAGVAEEADVTRLTIYRHFPEIESLFAACRAHWRALNPAPDTDPWLAIPDLEQRASLAFGQLYGWFGEHGDELFPIYRDAGSMPLQAQEALRGEAARIAGVLIEGHTGTGADGRRLRALAGHLVSFWTWHSLVRDQGLSNAEAADIAADLLIAGASRSA